MMTVQLPCTFEGCNSFIDAHIDTQGDPSVGIQPNGLEYIDTSSDCSHVNLINLILEDYGEDGLIAIGKFITELSKKCDAIYKAEAEAQDRS